MNYIIYVYVGDFGYAQRPWMMTPVLEMQQNVPIIHCNDRQKSSRVLIERCNGVLKMIF